MPPLPVSTSAAEALRAKLASPAARMMRLKFIDCLLSVVSGPAIAPGSNTTYGNEQKKDSADHAPLRFRHRPEYSTAVVGAAAVAPAGSMLAVSECADLISFQCASVSATCCGWPEASVTSGRTTPLSFSTAQICSTLPGA